MVFKLTGLFAAAAGEEETIESDDKCRVLEPPSLTVRISTIRL